MRYEDASQSGSSNNENPVARDDTDALAAGDRNPATGNVISGDDTQTGSIGADLGADAARIVSLSGAQGTDQSFAGGRLSVDGQFGRLSIDAEGNYSYRANADAPENSRDPFTYKLADAQGRSDTAVLTIEIGKSPAVVQANAQRVVVGPDGVVMLPAGVQLSDVQVLGRNLLVTLPDGSQMVIIDGAVFVPRLVIGDVEVPATNLAALLIDSEIRPAAGPPQSSGGNFEIPVGPLDPGVPLGDLIPPTELAYEPPIVEDVFDIIDDEPEILIQTPDQPLGVENATATVNENALPPRGLEPAGSNSASNGETTTGTIVFEAGDAPNVITVGGIAVTGVGQAIAGAYGVLTITSITPGAIGYSYTLGDNTIGDATRELFTVVITDADGDTDTATLTIAIVDDVPTARADVDSVREDGPLVADGNVLTGVGGSDANASDGVADTPGADGITVTGIAFGASAGALGAPLAGAYGSLILGANGNYVYTLNNQSGVVQALGQNESLTEVFTYTITDGDGDVRSTTLTITINGANDLPTIVAGVATVSDEGLAAGNPDSVGLPSDSSNSATATGQLVIGDVDGDALTVMLSAPAGNYSSGGQAISWSVSSNGQVLTGTAGGAAVITVTLANSGSYSVVLSRPIDHPNTAAEDVLSLSIPVSLSDGVASVSSTLTISLEDDSPVITSAPVVGSSVVIDETSGASPLSSGAPIVVTSAAAVISTGVSFGGDGPAAVPVVYGLALLGGGAVGSSIASGLQTALGDQPITLTLTSATLITATFNGGTQTAFTIQMNSNGTVTVSQFTALEHLVDGPTQSDYDDALSLVTNGSSLVSATATYRDGDGDSVSGAVAIGGAITFRDDGPSVTLLVTVPTDPQALDAIQLTTTDDGTEGASFTSDSTTAAFGGVFNLDSDGGADGTASAGISYQLGLLVAAGSDSGLDSNGAAIYLYIVGGVIVGSTSATAPSSASGASVVFTIGTTVAGVVTLTQFAQIDHVGEAPASGSPFADQLVNLATGLVQLTATAAIVDNDGDTDTDSASLDLGNYVRFADDGPDIAATLVQGATIRIDETDGVAAAGGEIDPAGGNLGTVTMAAASLFTVSTVAASADAPTVNSYTLSISAPGIASGLLLSTTNESIVLVNNGGVIEGRVANVGGAIAFTVSVDAATGATTLTQFLAVEHSNTASNDEDSSGLTAGVLSLNVTARDFDGDTDVASVDLGSIIRFEDDGPTVDVTADAAVEAGIVLTTFDDGTEGAGATVSATASGNFGGTFGLTFTTGSDGAATPSLTFALGTVGGASGLTSSGAAINLYLVGNVIVGSTAGIAPASATDASVVFAVSVSAAGVVTLTQYSQIDHPLAGDPSPSGTPFADQLATLADGAITLTARSTITDNDGDAASDAATINIGANLNFADDGPDIAATLVQGATIRIDETDGVAAAGGEIDPAGGNLGTVTVAAASLFTVATVAASADAPTVNSYALSISAPGIASGLLLSTTNEAIVLVNNGGVIEGRVANAGGAIAFTVSVDAATGATTLTQFLAVEHSNTASNDEDSSGLIAGVLSLNVTARDYDGDTDVASVDLGSIIRFEDDGPTAFADSNTVSEGGTVGGNVLTDGTDDVFGADGPTVVGGGVVGVRAAGGDTTSAVTTGVGTTITGLYGTLTLQANGSYSYDGAPNVTVTSPEVFVYTIRDGDGDLSTTTLTIAITPVTLVADNDTVTVNEAALDTSVTGNDVAAGSVTGSNPGSTAETAQGTLSIAGATGFTLTSAAVGTYGTLVLNANGSYTYTLTRPFDTSPDANNGIVTETGKDVFNYTATDADGNTVSGTISVDIVDDVPTAFADSNTVTEGATVGGNVLTDGTDDVFGADGPTVVGGGVVGVRAAGGDTTSAVTTGVGTTITGLYGTLTLQANGSYSYDGAPNVTVTSPEVFVYTIRDGDGDLSTTTLTIAITPVTLTASDTDALVDEKGLAAGGSGELADGIAGNNSDASETFNGAITPSGGTGPYTYALTSPAGGSYGTLTLNANGTYSYTLTQRYDTSPDANNSTNIEQDRDSFGYTVTDANGNTTTGTILVDIVDDVPTAFADSNTVSEGGTVGGNVLTDGTDDVFGADGPTVVGGGVVGVRAAGGDTTSAVTTGVGTVITGLYGTLTLQANGSYSYDGAPNVTVTSPEVFVYTIRDGDGDLSTTTLTISITPVTLVADNDTVTVNEAALDTSVTGNDVAAGSVTGSNPGSTAETAQGTLSIAGATGFTLTSAAVGTYGTLVLNANGSYTYTLTRPFDTSPDANNGIVTETGKDVFNYTATDADGNTVSGTISVDIVDDVPTAFADSNTVTEGATVGGNVLTDGTDDVFGADGPTVVGGGVVGVRAAGGDTTSAVTTGVGTTITGLYGTLTLQANGSYSYDGAPNVTVTSPEVFVYTIRDGDGDLSTTTLTIAITPVTLTASDTDALVDEKGLAAGGSGELADGIAGNNSDASETFNGAITPSGGTGPYTYALTSPAGGSYGTLTLNANGTYSYTLTQRYDTSPDANNSTNIEQDRDSFGYTVTDANGNTTTGTILVDIVDDVPTARSDFDTILEDAAAPALGNVITGDGTTTGIGGAGADTPGADGATVTGVKLPASGTYGAVSTLPAGTAIIGTYGTLTIQANGEYSYALNNTLASVQALDQGQVVSDVFNYQLSDGDGDLSNANLTINITGTNDIPRVNPDPARVSDEGPAFGNKDGDPVGTDLTNAAIFNGNLNIVDPDGTTTFTIGLAAPVGLTADGLAITFTGTGTNLLIGSVAGPSGAIEVVRVSVTNDGAYTVTLSRGIDHPAAGGEQLGTFSVPVTVSDGIATANSSISIGYEDDSPILIGTPGVVTLTGLSGSASFNYSIGGDQHIVFNTATGNRDIEVTGLTAKIGTTIYNNVPVTLVSATAGDEVFSFSFQYDANPSPTVTDTRTASGTISFDKEGSYTVTLDAPIASFTVSSVQNGEAPIFYDRDVNNDGDTNDRVDVDNGIAVVELAPDFFVQFTGASGVTGSDGSFGNDELFGGGSPAEVKISSTAIGVFGNSVQDSDVLDYNFYASNPLANDDLPPSTSAGTAFVQISQFNGSEDFIVVLKLANPATPGTFITRTIVVESTDVLTSNVPGYPTLNNGEGLIIIEPDDYINLAGVPDNFQIVGIQLRSSTEGLASEPNEVYNFDGDLGQFDSSTTVFGPAGGGDQGTNDNEVFKILDVGVVRTSTNSQSLALDFTVQVTDADGDSSATTHLLVNTTTQIAPVALDTNHDGVISYLGLEAGVGYDYNGDGKAEGTAWVAPGDSILVRDADGNGTVSNASEFVFGGNNMTDLEALHAQYGAQLDASDAGFVQFMLWNDANSNGIADAGELQSLADAEVQSLDLVSDGKASTAAGGDIAIAGEGRFAYVNDNGATSTGLLADVTFRTVDRESELAQRVSNASNSAAVVTAAAVAAMGLAAGQAAAQGRDPASDATDNSASSSSQAPSKVEGTPSVAASDSRSLLTNEVREIANDDPSAGRSEHAAATDEMRLAADPANEGQSMTSLVEPSEGSLQDHVAVNPVAPMIVMPSAEAFAAGADGQAVSGLQRSVTVEKVLADALQGGAADGDIDALLAGLAGRDGGGNPALDALATANGEAVSGWDTGSAAHLSPNILSNIVADMAAFHHDAVQPAING